MANINVKMNGLANSAGDIKSSMGRLRPVGAEVRKVSENLDGLSVGTDSICASLKKLSDDLDNKVRSGLDCSTQLELIVQHYRDTEAGNAAETVSVSKIAETSVSLAMAGVGVSSIFNWFRSLGNTILDFFVDYYESKNPKAAKAVNDFLNSDPGKNLTDEEKQEIKRLIYTAEEPYRSIYLKNLSKIKIGSTDLKDTAYYKTSEKTVNYTHSNDYYDSFDDDPRGPYTTFFHECGHGIDDVADITNKDGYDTTNFTYHSDAMGKNVTLMDAIRYDVYDNPSNPHSVRNVASDIMKINKSLNGANVENVIKAMKNDTYASLNSTDQRLYEFIQNEHRGNVRVDYSHYESVTDVYGGVTHNALDGDGYSHDKSYWEGKNNTMAAKELWAEYFSYNMADGTENLAHLREYFPESSKVLDAYANSF